MTNRKRDWIRKGTKWLISTRGGTLVVQMLDGVDASEDHFVDVLILHGEKHYASIGNKIQQKISGMGTPGDQISVRTSLTQFRRRLRTKSAVAREIRSARCER